MSEKYEFEVAGDYIVRKTRLPEYGDGVYKVEIIADKASFVEAFEKWCKQNAPREREVQE